MTRATRLRITERARIQRVTAAGLRWSPGRRAPVHRRTPLSPAWAADDVAVPRGTPIAEDPVPLGETLPVPPRGRIAPRSAVDPCPKGKTLQPPHAEAIVLRSAGEVFPVKRILFPDGTACDVRDQSRPGETISVPRFPGRRRDELEREIMQRADIRSFRSTLATFASFFLALAIAIGVLGAPASPACAQIGWLNAEDGDILNVSSADGPPAGSPFFQARRSIERSEGRGTLVMSRLRLLYGVTPEVTVGVSGLHLEQQLSDSHKRGLGDTNLSLKLHYAPWPEQPIRIGLRQTLSLPTGYELEMDGLAPFTSRRNDYTAQILGQYVTPEFAAYVNPGVVLPGGRADSYVSGGLGVAFGIPLGLDVRGEYYTRWDMVTRQFESEAYVGMRRQLLLGLGVQAGVRRRLLQNETVDPEFQLGLTLGRDRKQEGQLYAFRERVDTGLLVHPVQTAIPDPYGLGNEFAESFRTEPVVGKTQPAVYVSSVGGNTPPTGGVVLPRASEWVTTLATPRTYELNVKILEIRDAEIGGLDLSPVARVSRARTTVVGQCELIAPDGYSVLTRRLYEGIAAKVLSLQLAPESGSLAADQAPDELRSRLRRAAVRDLVRQVHNDVIHTIQMRDYQ